MNRVNNADARAQGALASWAVAVIALFWYGSGAWHDVPNKLTRGQASCVSGHDSIEDQHGEPVIPTALVGYWTVNSFHDQSRRLRLLPHKAQARLLLKCGEHVGAVAAWRLARIGSVRVLAREKRIARPLDVNVEHSRKLGTVVHSFHQHGFLQKSRDLADGDALSLQSLTHAAADRMTVRAR